VSSGKSVGILSSLLPEQSTSNPQRQTLGHDDATPTSKITTVVVMINCILCLILNQLLFAGIYVIPIGHICFWFWTNDSLRVYMSFQSDTCVSDSEPTTLCGYICRSNRTHLFLILNQLLFAGIYVVPIGHMCFWFWNIFQWIKCL
jgi:hypothetical protein